MAPASNTSTPGHPRLAQLAHSSTSGSLSSLQNSPSTSRSSRNLGAIGGRSGPGYSPYARRVSRAVAAHEEEDVEDDATIRGDESEPEDSPVQQRNGLFGRVKSLPGKALGWLTRSSSSRTLSSSTSLADVRAAVEEEQAKEQGTGMQRSSTTHNLSGRSGGGETPSALPSRLRRQPLQKDSLPSSSSMSALSSVASPFAPSGLRSSHSTLNLASTAANGSAVPSFLTTSNLSRHSRAVSPALSSASYAHSRRSPSPMRNGLAGSMSTFNLAQPRSPASAFGGPDPTLGNAALSNGSNPFGLTSRSPFVAGRNGSQRAVSVAGSVRSASTRPEGHALFPYTSTIPRGASPSIAASQSMREGLSSFASAASPQPNSAPSTAQKRPYARVGSPLNPRSPFPPQEGEDPQANGFERARKKQMVWDPSRGLISRERLEAEKERDAPPLPKNEAERILEVLEGMGRTPLGEAKRGAIRPKKISVPAPVSPGLSSGARTARSLGGPSAAPYSARSVSLASDAASSGKGLQSVLRAREERRRALVEQEREERERERREKEERERRRDERRRELERLEREADEEDELESVMSQDYEDEDDRPRRRTRSSTAASKSKSKNLEPPTPRRSTRASSRNVKSPSPAPTPKKKGKSKRVQEDTEENVDDADMEPPSTRQKRPASKSPAPPSETTEHVRSQSPPPPPKIVFPPPPVSSTSSSNPSQRSSLRPGKSHSSRQHTASSKVFSAREEDLPPIDDDALSKIQMPAMKFPAGFSFGGASSAPAAAKKPEEEPKSTLSFGGDKKDEGSSLLGRLSAPPATAASTDKPAFSFTPSAPSTSTSTIPPLPAISFGTAGSTAKPATSLFKPAEPSTDLFAPKPSSTGFSFATPSTSTPVPKPSTSAPTTEGDKPNFFASIVNEKKDEAPKIAPLPSFSFGASISTPVVKPTEVVTPEAEKEKKDVAPPAANPFAAFGKPVSEIIKESREGTKDEAEKPAEVPEAPKAAFSFGAATKPSEAASTSTTTGSAFSFKPASSASTPAASSPFSFGSAKPAEKAKEPEAAAPAFSFGASSTAPSTSTPKATFTFGTTPATPNAEEKAPTPLSSAPASPFGALAPPAPASVAGTDDADGDSGMEDEAEPSTSAASKPAAPAPFTFGAAAPSATTSTSSGLFGSSSTSAPPASTGFSFGSSDKKETPSLFGAPSASSSSASLFGGASAAAKPFTFGSPSPSPAPSSPAVASASSPFSFGQTATSTAPTSTFSFGSTPAANPSPFGAPAQPASPAPASTGFTFGASSSNAPAPPAAPFAFGSSTAAPASSTMGQTLSAPGTNGGASPFGAPAANGGGFTFGSSASQPVSPSASTATPSFSFGAPAAPAGGSTFSFGAPSSGQAPAAASPFGAPSPAAAAGGFSFGAPTASGATTPTGGGLFNLGSGGEDAAAKSGRPIRPLRRRK